MHPPLPTVAFLGLGAMGRRMAARLADAGVSLVLWNRTPLPALLPAVPRAPSPREAAARADVVLSMVTDDAAARAVWRGPSGALAGMRSGAVAVECSTITPAWARELSAAAEEGGAVLVAAPVVGTLPHAEAGSLSVLAGGDAAALHTVAPILEVLGTLRRLGDVEAAAAAKLAVNGLFAVQVAALGEAVSLLVGHGVPQHAAVALLCGGPVASPALQGIGALVQAGDHAPRFPVRLVAKDLRQALGRGPGPAPVLAATAAAFARAEARHGDRNLSVLGDPDRMRTTRA